jgi:hypothetical protein
MDGAMPTSVHERVRASLDAGAVLAAGPARLRQLEKRFTTEHFHTELREGDAEDPVPGVLALRLEKVLV